jgi:serine phosphatase RsbU (regulator of sigma subunit)/ligand-binding sensor domain-containing protein
VKVKIVFILQTISHFLATIRLKMKIRLCLCVWVSIIFLNAWESPAQIYQLNTYQIEQGLPANLTKATVKDKTGFMWVATDEGVARFDGKNFLNLKKELPSNYTKSLYVTREGKLWIINDGGILEVVSQADTVIFKTLLPGSADNNDLRKVMYPKDVMQDCGGRFWISEAYSILRYDKGKTARYKFPQKYHTNSFSRSFKLTETKCGALYMAAYTGNLFYYNPAQDLFVEMPQKEITLQDITAMLSIDEHTLWIGETEGVVEVKLDEKHEILSAKRIIALNDVSYMQKDAKGNIFIGTWNNGLHEVEFHQDKFISFRINDSKADVINHIFADNEHNLWVSSDDGVELLRPNIFHKIALSNRNTFIESITWRSGQMVLVCDGSAVYEIMPKADKYEKKLRYNAVGKNLLSVHQGKEYTWVGTGNGTLIQWKEKEAKEIDLSPYGKGIFNSYESKDGNVWISQYERKEGIVRLSPQGELRLFGKSEGITSLITVVREAPNGRLYCAGNAEKAFLYQWNPTTQKFENLSQALTYDSKIPLSVNDMCIDAEGQLWLATNHGLWQYKDKKFEVLDLGSKFTYENIKAVWTDAEKNVWIGTNLGLIKYYNKQWVLLEKVNGLSTVTISPRGVLETEKGNLFIATAIGLNYSPELLGKSHVTPPPIFISLRINDQNINGKPVRNTFDFNATLQAAFISFTYPNQPVLYQYRLKGLNNEWSEPGTQNQIMLPRIPAGKYELEVRAKQQGNYTWSQPLHYSFSVQQAWYFTWWAVLGYIVVAAAVVWAVVSVYTRRLQSQKAFLSLKVTEATREIEARAQSLHEANAQLKEQKAVTEDAFKLIEFKNRKITDSIRYARTIQRAILPEEATLAKTFQEHFVIYKPKDVVSGDFYWLLRVEGKNFMAVVDCTGHGVPGAFMSMIGHTLLYRIIKLKNVYSPARILEMLHAEVRVVLRQRQTNSVDGMDACLCALEKLEEHNPLSPTKITFAGAKLPLYYYQNGSLGMLEEDRKAIGGIQNEQRHFTNKEIILQAGDMLYLTSDGYTDQNNAKRKKLGADKFCRLVEANTHLKMQEQKELLEKALDKHQEGTEQRDDITVVGLRL